MKNKILRRGVECALAAAIMAGCLAVRWQADRIPSVIYTSPGQQVSLNALPGVEITEKAQTGRVSTPTKDSSRNARAELFGVLPLKNVRVVEREHQTVKICGELFGIKMFADGALVVGFSELYTVYGPQNPARDAGLKLGDWVVSLAGKKILCNEDIAEIIQTAASGPLPLTYRREGVLYQTQITPVKDQNGTHKAGIWVRDSSAGIGTMTFVMGNRFAGLGHAINDSDTGECIELRSGEIVPVELKGVEKGSAGATGELQGRFLSSKAMGEIERNLPVGVFGTLFEELKTECLLEAAWMQEIKTGPAQILCNVDGCGPRYYTVNIEKIDYTAAEVNKNMLLKVTDPSLLEITGGIVQGMSGSPIIQDGKLVGAVTHVLVNDPARGYGIFIENMLEAAK